MVLPLAQIVHSTNHRLRLRIKGRRGDDPYFSDLEAKLGVAFASFKVLASPVTGSIAVSGDRVEERAVCDFGRREALFRVAPAKSEPQTLPLSIIANSQPQYEGGHQRPPGLAQFAVRGPSAFWNR